MTDTDIDYFGMDQPYAPDTSVAGWASMDKQDGKLNGKITSGHYY
jgi:hypothetical protein